MALTGEYSQNIPATSGKRNEKGVSDSCQMKEAVEPEKLQRALDLCVEDYAFFSVYCGADSFGTIWRKLI